MPFVVAGVIVACVCAGLLSPPVPATPEPRDHVAARKLQQNARVILVTIDGPVRDDVLAGLLMPTLREKATVVKATVASPYAMSLPGYQALAVGMKTQCLDNDCDRVVDETMHERLARRLAVSVDQVAVFASWSRIRRAVSSKDGAVLFDAPDDCAPHEGGPRWKNARFDDETFELAKTHWVNVKPRFMQVSFLDSDEWAHSGRRDEYEQALRRIDGRINEMISWLDDQTTLIITADHGRGKWSWRQHGFFHFGSAEVFVAAIGPSVKKSETEVSQLDVAPTIERLFGLCPAHGDGRGEAIPAWVERLPCTE